jgi:hypothetical protein
MISLTRKTLDFIAAGVAGAGVVALAVGVAIMSTSLAAGGVAVSGVAAIVAVTSNFAAK